MTFAINTAGVRYATDDAPVLLHDPPALGYLVRVDLARERISARLAFPEDLTGPHVGGLAPLPLPTPTTDEPCVQDFGLSLPPGPAEAVEAWLMGVLAPLVETVRAGTEWAGPLNLHAADPLQRLLAGFSPQASDALMKLAEAQRTAWERGLDVAAALPESWRAYTWCHARVSDLGDEHHGALGGFTADEVRYLRSPEGGQIRQWWPESAAELARLLAETTPAWAHRPHRAHRNQGLAVLVWDRPELALEVRDIEDGRVPGPDAVAQAVVAHPA